MLFSFLLSPDNASFWVYVFASVVGLGTGGIVVMIYAIFPDIPDVDELHSGERREAIYSALVTFIRKFSSALAIFAVSMSSAGPDTFRLFRKRSTAQPNSSSSRNPKPSCWSCD